LENGPWQTLFQLGRGDWLEILKKYMEMYSANIDGTKIEVRKSTIIWNYKKSHEEHGEMFAKTLADQIEHLLGTAGNKYNNAPVEIVCGNGYVEVKPKKLKKKKLIKRFLRELHE